MRQESKRKAGPGSDKAKGRTKWGPFFERCDQGLSKM